MCGLAFITRTRPGICRHLLARRRRWRWLFDAGPGPINSLVGYLAAQTLLRLIISAYCLAFNSLTLARYSAVMDLRSSMVHLRTDWSASSDSTAVKPMRSIKPIR